jgi:hypothetical protein
VGAAQPEDEAAREPRLEVGVQGGHVVDREPVDRQDAGGDAHRRRALDGGGDLVEVLQRAAGEPHRLVAHALQLGGGGHEPPVAVGVHDRTDATQLDLRHGDHLSVP